MAGGVRRGELRPMFHGGLGRTQGLRSRWIENEITPRDRSAVIAAGMAGVIDKVLQVVSVEPVSLRRAQAFPADCGEKGDILMSEVYRERMLRNVRLLA